MQLFLSSVIKTSSIERNRFKFVHILNGSTTVYTGSRTTITFNNPTIGELLSNFSSYRDWTGSYYCYDCPIITNAARFRIYNNGSWQFYDNEVYRGSGSLSLVEWNDYALIIKFRFESGGPFASYYISGGYFYYENGPADWSKIQYFPD